MTRHHVTAHFNPGESRLVVDDQDISRSVTKAGTRIDFDHEGRPVLTVQTAPGVTIDLDLEDAEVRVQQVRPLKALGLLGNVGIEGDDAVTALDTFITRTAGYLNRYTAGMTAAERAHWLAGVYGSDALRVAAVMLEANS